MRRLLLLILVTLVPHNANAVDVEFNGFPEELGLISGSVPTSLGEYDWRKTYNKREEHRFTIRFRVDNTTGRTTELPTNQQSFSNVERHFLDEASRWIFKKPDRDIRLFVTFHYEVSKRSNPTKVSLRVDNIESTIIPWVYGDTSVDEYVSKLAIDYTDWARENCEARFDHWIEREPSELEAFIRRKESCQAEVNEISANARKAFTMMLPFLGHVQAEYRYSVGLERAIGECLYNAHFNAINDINSRTWQPMFRMSSFLGCAQDAKRGAEAVEHYKATGEVLDRPDAASIDAADRCGTLIQERGMPPEISPNGRIVADQAGAVVTAATIREFLCNSRITDSFNISKGDGPGRYKIEALLDGSTVTFHMALGDSEMDWRILAMTVLGVRTALSPAESLALVQGIF